MSSLDQNTAIHWKVELLRFTAFFQPGIEVDASGWWKDVVVNEPESRVEKPREGSLHEEGPLLGGRLILSAAPQRVDWLLVGNMNDVVEKGTYEPLPRYDDCVHPFSELIKRWFVLNVPLVRIAWGSVLLGPVENREQGYSQIARYLPKLNIDPIGSSDFIYQINRPRSSKTVDRLKINRLNKWSVGLLQSGTLQLGQPPTGARVTTGVAQVRGPSLSACRLELDINTVAENVELIARELLGPLLDEIIDLANEISQQGDVP